MTNVVERRMLDILESQASLTDKILQNKLREGQTPAYIMSYAYTASWTNVPATAAAANTAVISNIVTNGDSDFLACYMSSAFFNTATQVFVSQPYARLQVTDNSSQRSMFNVPAYLSNITGFNGFPYLLQDSKLVPANTIMICSLYNDSTVGPISYDGQVCFGGYRVFYQNS